MAQSSTALRMRMLERNARRLRRLSFTTPMLPLSNHPVLHLHFKISAPLRLAQVLHDRLLLVPRPLLRMKVASTKSAR